ncbi:serine-rich adhesin for platelets [Drosophila santomea]|uniref:serine-rich adhesin for platelets n=1 Tax=Drosophila santomea TaxID=129105 RepID=UPI001952F09A|nr:serine-rich adhesin for platelets [Drosophila santomea]
MSLMKIHRGNESFCSCWLLLLLLVALLLAEAVVAAATLSETQTNATNGAIREPPVQLQQQQQQQLQLQLQLNATAGDGESRNSAEIFSHGDVDVVGDKPTTYRPSGANRPSIAPLNSAQDRERKLMNVLAARRTALHRGGFRTRIGTTGRSAISPSAAVESTSKAPSDPRSVCIRNCTKNFTRRTTASCMRQCANFTRMAMPSNGNSSVVLKGSASLKAAAPAGDRDTNEILFSDESSHGLFVVAKEQNATLNHIADGTKPAVMGKGIPSKTNSMEEDVEDDEEDELKPYVYFGAKLPPIRPGGLTIKAAEGDDDHPRVLEVSVAQSTAPIVTTTSTTPAPVSSTRPTASTRRPLTPVERSRSKYKYHMRERGLVAAAAPPPAAAPPAPPVSRTRYVGSGRPTAGIADSSQDFKQTESEVAKPVVRRLVQKVSPSSSTPLIITVLSAEEETTVAQTEALPTEESTTTTSTTTTTERPRTTTSTSTTTTTPVPSTTKRTTTTAPLSTTSTTTTTSSTTPSTTTTSSTSTTAMPTTTKANSIIEKDKELIRALGPALTREINIDDANNLIVFCNNTSDCGVTPRTQTQPSHTTDSSPKILRTTVLTSIRSTVHPRPTSTSTTTSTTTTAPPPVTAPSNEVYIGIVESSSSASPADISSTVIANERDLNMEMRRMNLVTLVLVAVGVIPLAAIILYLVRNFVTRRRAKQSEVFDVCITDQQPISPVKKVDSKYQVDDDEDEVDHPHHQHMQHHQNHPSHQHHQAMPMSQASQRDANHNRYGNNDDKTSLASEFQEFERSNIRLKSLLGEGNFGQVWKAEADDLSGHFGATRIVAVKTIRACSAQVSLKDEANIMRKLGSHQNVVTLLGACVEGEPHMLIMEYAMRGRLLSLLRAARSATNILPASVPGGRSLAPLSPRTLAGFALDIACGMEYIAGRRIVHRDLAARNVLLDHNGMCKICDFGMSIDLDAERLRKEQEKNAANDLMRHNAHKFKFDFGSRYILQHWQHTFGQGQGQGHCSKDHPHGEKKSRHGHDTIGKRHALPIRWMAPESLQYHMFTTETDIWAFGIVLWEIATLGSTPYSQLTGREVIRRVPQGLRPDLPKESRHEFYNLMSRCWHKEPHMRPSFAQSRLEITRSLHKWVDDDSAASDYMDVSGFSEDLEHGVVYFNHRISEFECEI